LVNLRPSGVERSKDMILQELIHTICWLKLSKELTEPKVEKNSELR
jgi:hypothetical protein